MEQSQIKKRITRESLDRLFPPDLSDRFFEALLGEKDGRRSCPGREDRMYYPDTVESAGESQQYEQ